MESAVNRRPSPALASPASPTSRARAFVFAFLLALFVASGVAAVSPEAGAARALPQHCDELIHGDCDDPWLCLVACFMEMLGLEDYCSQHPNSPQCQ